MVSTQYFYYFNNTLIIIDTTLLIWNQSLKNDIYQEIEFIIGAYYLFEMSSKILAYGFLINSDSYLRNKWNILDFSIAISIIFSRFFAFYTNVDLTIFRNLVVLRLLRIKSFDLILERLYFVMKDYLKTLFFVWSILISLAILCLHLLSGFLKYRCLNEITGLVLNDVLCGNYVCDIGYVCIKSLNNVDNGVSNFDNIFSSFMQTLKIITFNNWTDSLLLIQKTFFQFSIILFLILIIVGNFIVLNLILAILKVKYSEGINKINSLNKVMYKIFDFKKIKKYTLMLGKKLDSNIFNKSLENSNFMKSLYSLRFTSLKSNKYERNQKNKYAIKKKKFNFFIKILNKYFFFGLLKRKNTTLTPLQFLKNKHLELIVDFKMNYHFDSIQDILLEKYFIYYDKF